MEPARVHAHARLPPCCSSTATRAIPISARCGASSPHERATFVGISPAFIGLCTKAGFSPREHFDLSSIRTVGSTGSPLTEDGYRWVYDNVHADLLLASISGGTDPGTAFVGACPILPVYAGEMQCRGLGIATYAYDDDGRPVLDQVGELVCTEPFPSMPLVLLGRHGRHAAISKATSTSGPASGATATGSS